MAYCNGLVRAAQRQRFQSRTLHCRKFAELEEKWSMNGAALWNLGKEQPHSNGFSHLLEVIFCPWPDLS